jgi:hypothetical protein
MASSGEETGKVVLTRGVGNCHARYPSKSVMRMRITILWTKCLSSAENEKEDKKRDNCNENYRKDAAKPA